MTEEPHTSLPGNTQENQKANDGPDFYVPSAQEQREFVRQVRYWPGAALSALWRFEADEAERWTIAGMDAGLVSAQRIREGEGIHVWQRNAVAALLQERERMADAGVPTSLIGATPARAQALAKRAEGDKPSEPIALTSAADILKREFTDPVWAVPNLLPAGLTILAGAPKIGKSFLALQIALSVASGGVVLGERVERGSVLYLALEDTERRLQARMRMQNWAPDLPANFMCIGRFNSQVGDLRRGGAEKLASQIEQDGYRLVVIDTLSRAMRGDQNDVGQMTWALEPLQEIAHANNVALILIDHHRKPTFENEDVVSDILGSTAKTALADTVLGLYRERGKHGAKLRVTGRDVEERTLALAMDWVTGCWQLDGDAKAGEQIDRQGEILEALSGLGGAQVDAIANAIGQDRGNTYRRLQDLVASGVVMRTAKGKSIYYHT
jgi:AAA domain-containing protein/IclR-like helix-turn-helix domain-containing protein